MRFAYKSDNKLGYVDGYSKFRVVSAFGEQFTFW